MYLRRDFFVTRLVGLKKENATKINELLKEVSGTALEQFKREGIKQNQVRFLRYGKFRYENQEHSVEILLPGGTIQAKAISKIAEDFHQAYEREYTYRLNAPVEFVGTHIVALASIGKLKPVKLPVTGRKLAKAKKGERKVDFALGGIHLSNIYDGDLLEPNMKFKGPAIIETKGTTVVIHPDNQVTIDDYGNAHISIQQSGRK
jgi:N-methylhydantoinase A